MNRAFSYLHGILDGKSHPAIGYGVYQGLIFEKKI